MYPYLIIFICGIVLILIGRYYKKKDIRDNLEYFAKIRTTGSENGAHFLRTGILFDLAFKSYSTEQEYFSGLVNGFRSALDDGSSCATVDEVRSEVIKERRDRKMKFIWRHGFLTGQQQRINPWNKSDKEERLFAHIWKQVLNPIEVAVVMKAYLEGYSCQRDILSNLTTKDAMQRVAQVIHASDS